MSFSVYLKTPEEINIMEENGKILGEIFAFLKDILKPNMKAIEINNQVEAMILKHGATPSFKGYQKFPFAICFCLNSEVIHGFPSQDKTIQDGDLVSIDIGIYKNGFHADSAFTFGIGNVSPEAFQLTKATQESLYLGIQACKIGNSLFDIAKAIQNRITITPFSIVRDFVGHGVGRNIHEAPQIPNFVQKNLSKIKLKEGMTLAIEPMINLGSHHVEILEDHWTVVTKDRKLSAHFEHTIAITKQGPKILTFNPSIHSL